MHRELAEFVLKREQKYIDPRYKVYTFLTDSNRSRQTGIVAVANIGTHKVRVLSEITFAPLGFVMAPSSEPPDKRLVDISFFATYSYNDWKHIPLNLPSLPIYTYLPGDYRSREQVIVSMKEQEPYAFELSETMRKE